MFLRPPHYILNIAPRQKPNQLTVPVYPFINVGLARKALDVSDFRTRTVGLNLPIILGNSPLDKDDTGRFAHTANMTLKRADS